jgi:hypothetical protein
VSNGALSVLGEGDHVCCVAICCPLRHSCAGQYVLQRRVKIEDQNVKEHKGSEGKKHGDEEKGKKIKEKPRQERVCCTCRINCSWGMVSGDLNHCGS